MLLKSQRPMVGLRVQDRAAGNRRPPPASSILGVIFVSPPPHNRPGRIALHAQSMRASELHQEQQTVAQYDRLLTEVALSLQRMADICGVLVWLYYSTL